jgi:hypothetical protein
MGPLGADDRPLELGRELGVAKAFGYECHQHRTGIAAESVDHGLEHAGQVGPHVAGVRKVIVEARAEADGFDDQLGLARVAPVDRGFADAGARRDAFDAHPGVPVLRERSEGGGEEGLVTRRVAATAGSSPLAAVHDRYGS